MPDIDLYVDVNTKGLVYGLDRPVPFELPEFHQQNEYIFNLYPLRRQSFTRAPYFGYDPVTGLSAKILLGTAGSILAQTDLTNVTANGKGLTGPILSLATSGIDALADGTELIFEIRMAGTSKFTAQKRVKFRKTVYTAGALVPVVGETAMSVRDARAEFLPKELAPGEGIIFTSPDGTKKRLLTLENDDQPRWLQLT